MTNSAFRGNITAQKFEPQGRLTLVTGTPVMATEQAAKTTIYYTPYKGDMIPINSGGQFTAKQFSELSLALDSDSGHTGYHQSGKNFDLFIVNDSGTLRLASGPAWTDDTTRATALEYEQGLLVNNGSMTARFGSASGNTLTIADEEGTYVGTFRASANGTTTWELGGAAAGGDPGFLYLWNCYNRANIGVVVKDSTDNWTYGTAAWRSKNGSTSNRVSFVVGLAEDAVVAENMVLNSQPSDAGNSWAAIGYDSVTSLSGTSVSGLMAAAIKAVGDTALMDRGFYTTVPSVGFHFIQAIEYVNFVAASATYYGDAGAPTFIQDGLLFSGAF